MATIKMMIHWGNASIALDLLFPLTPALSSVRVDSDRQGKGIQFSSPPVEGRDGSI
jgi:hypothetical protein